MHPRRQLRSFIDAKFTAGLPDGGDVYLVSPSSPVRVFAGD